MLNAKLETLGFGWLPGVMGLVFWSLVIGLLYLLVKWVRAKKYPLAALAGVSLVALLYLPANEYIKYRTYLAKYEPAKALFDKLCAEQSQPIIKRTVEDVEGILLLKVRPSTANSLHMLVRNPMWEGAAFVHERTEDSGYSEYFLLDRNWGWDPSVDKQAPGMRPSIGKAYDRGFRYVDVLDADGKRRTRITAQEAKDQPNPLVQGIRFDKQEATAPSPRFAVTFEDNVDPELRKHWIAGTTVKVLDMETGEVIGQRSFWTWESGFGNANQRLPWALAKGCPAPDWAPGVRTHKFVDQVLKAKREK